MNQFDTCKTFRYLTAGSQIMVFYVSTFFALLKFSICGCYLHLSLLPLLFIHNTWILLIYIDARNLLPVITVTKIVFRLVISVGQV